MQHYSINNVHEGRFAVYEHATRRIVHYAKTREGCEQWINSCVRYLRKENYIAQIDNTEVLVKSVVYYRDPEAKDRVCRNPWQDRPTRRNKWVMLNGVCYRACWLPDLPENA
jgi:hypothetical protein